MKLLDKVEWNIVVILALTLGLAPFSPPHIWEKLNMLAAGTLSRPIDIFDLFFHGGPWGLLLAKAAREMQLRSAQK